MGSATTRGCRTRSWPICSRPRRPCARWRRTMWVCRFEPQDRSGVLVAHFFAQRVVVVDDGHAPDAVAVGGKVKQVHAVEADDLSVLERPVVAEVGGHAGAF